VLARGGIGTLSGPNPRPARRKPSSSPLKARAYAGSYPATQLPS